MNKNEYQKSGSLRFILLNIFCSKATGHVEAKFHVEVLLVGGTKSYSNSPGRVAILGDFKNVSPRFKP